MIDKKLSPIRDEIDYQEQKTKQANFDIKELRKFLQDKLTKMQSELMMEIT